MKDGKCGKKLDESKQSKESKSTVRGDKEKGKPGWWPGSVTGQLGAFGSGSPDWSASVSGTSCCTPPVHFQDSLTTMHCEPPHDSLRPNKCMLLNQLQH